MLTPRILGIKTIQRTMDLEEPCDRSRNKKRFRNDTKPSKSVPVAEYASDHIPVTHLTAMFKGNKPNELKGGNQKFSRVGAGVGFQPTITHPYVFHVSMGDRGDGHPSDTTLLNTLAPVLVAHGLLTHGTTKLPSPATKRTKN
ncbi:hypothetical protein PoB_003085500 [Plakobranchus ocellatus]|uniref:Uncharacterized protein n=1 Tax=Plakobranchus ocellatus TaxID=259542 RepID=A0AAV4AC05_9GAST|nr:hypothetical protein PoB_003085500 [Plakobranchus ocellatus]